MNDTPITKGDMQTILDHITSERQKTENYVHEELEYVHEKLEKANNRMDAMQKGIGNLRKDVSTLKSDVSTLKSDVSTLKEGQARIDNNVTTIADELGILDKIKTA